MGPHFLVQTLLERRQGIDILALPHERITRYAEPDSATQREGGFAEGGLEISA